MGTDLDIVTRAEWGAKRPKSRRLIQLPVKKLWLHHTAGSERGAAGVRRIQDFHMAPKPHGRGWADGAYSWVYCLHERRFFEMRGAGVAGAHTQGYNSTSHALCIMGNFDRDPVPDTLIADVAEFVRWHGQFGPDRISGGHRDVGATSCPGGNLYRRIPDINAVAADPYRFVPHEEDDDVALRRGAGGPAVKAFQNALVREAQHAGRPHPLPDFGPDGDFGGETEKAVRAYQSAAKVPESGAIDGVTAALLARYITVA